MKNKKKILIVGAGGHSSIIIDIIEQQQLFDIVALIVDGPLENNNTLNYRIINNYHNSGIQVDSFIVAIGDDLVRKKKFLQYCDAGLEPVNIIHSSVIIAPNVGIGLGNVIAAGVVINTYAQIGNNIILNTKSIIEHNVTINHHSQISPGAILCGNSKIGNLVNIGAGSVIHQNITICSRTIIGCGAIVIESIAFPGTYVGIPVRKIK